MSKLATILKISSTLHLYYPLVKMYTLSEFRELESIARRLGFKSVVAHPLARTSYRAKEAYLEVVGGGS